MGSGGSSQICMISCAARRLSILLLPGCGFRKRAVEHSAAEAKERGCVPGRREKQDKQSRDLHTGLCNKVSFAGLGSCTRLWVHSSPLPVETSLSYSGERQMFFTANIPLQMLNREFIWRLHFCYCSMKAVPGRTTQANEGEKTSLIQVASRHPCITCSSKDVKGQGNEKGWDSKCNSCVFHHFLFMQAAVFLIGTVKCYYQSADLTTQLF